MVRTLFFFSILVLSQAATLVRFADASSLAICFWRLGIAAVILLPFMLRERGYRRVFALPSAQKYHLILSGFFLFAHFYFFFRSVMETSIASATIIFSLNPVSTALGAWLFFRQRVSTVHIYACGLGFLGVAVLFWEPHLIADSTGTDSVLGDLWGVASALCFSGYILTGKSLRTQLPNFTYTFFIYLFTAVASALGMLVLKVSFFDYSAQTWLAFAALALLPTLFGHVIFTYCLGFLNVNFMSCMTLTEPVLAALTAVWIFQEHLTQYAVIGFTLTCASVIILYWPKSKDQTP
jgi:drug/metabolite transporter (DMT)-like permease